MAGSPAFHSTTFIFGKPTPNPRILATFQGPLQTWFANLATHADFLCFFNLGNRWASVSNRKEKFWVFIAAC
jgi:hypothetical protein